MKIITITGARPQFIKLAPLSAALRGAHEEIMVHTGQHYDYSMSGKIFSDLGISKPAIHLEISNTNTTGQITEMMIKLEEAMLRHKPALVIVFGDTNSTLAGALIAGKLNIPLLHIEAGLRSYNRRMPEEMNRIVTDHLSQYLFAPTESAVHILKEEGLQQAAFFTGDIMIDSMKKNLDLALKKSSVLTTHGLVNKDYNLLTLHRNYNVDNTRILEHLLKEIAMLDEEVIFPVHPRTGKMLPALYEVPANIKMIEPQGYLDFITLEHSAKRIITDSGGIQKEAYILRKPCITLRTETEWVETVEEKWNLLINPEEELIASKIASFSPSDKQKEVFGKNVTKKMITIINDIN